MALFETSHPLARRAALRPEVLVQPKARPVAPAPAPIVPAGPDLSRFDPFRERWMSKLMDNSDLFAKGEVERSVVREALTQIAELDSGALSRSDREQLIEDMVLEVCGLGPLEALLADDDISEIMVNTASKIFIERKGLIEETSIRFRDEEALLRACKKIATGVNRTVDGKNPVCDARLKDGSRVNVIIPPLAVDGTHLTIRKFKKDKLKLEDLVAFGALTSEAAHLLRIIGKIRVNVLISGGTGSGKTTLLNCLTASIPENERVITLEDTAELQLQQPHVVRLETRPENSEGVGAFSMQELVKNALRMKPHRIIVGEVRDGAAFDLIQAMNTGHEGSMGTIHANNPAACLARLESLILMNPGSQTQPSHVIRKSIVDSIEIIIQTKQLMPSGRRVITHVTEVGHMEENTIILSDLLRFSHAEGRLVGTKTYRPSRLIERAEEYGEGANLLAALADANRSDP
ncbi:CpaF family protein [Castellaniella sp.]|uniref:CpaF family protein n=1 Tax=Castellaniella sp. TaxID=1955812 RepID=UPI002AFFA7E2|nr:CpaF family protein [Castellaniella sp.]